MSLQDTDIQGGANISRGLNVGGDGTVRGSMTVGHDLRVKGWLDAPNVKGTCKGLFASEGALRGAYPRPSAGWTALVGSTLPAAVWRADRGEDGQWRWVSTGETGGAFDVRMESVEGEISTLREDMEARTITEAETLMYTATGHVLLRSAHNAKNPVRITLEGAKAPSEERPEGVAGLMSAEDKRRVIYKILPEFFTSTGSIHVYTYGGIMKVDLDGARIPTAENPLGKAGLMSGEDKGRVIKDIKPWFFGSTGRLDFHTQDGNVRKVVIPGVTLPSAEKPEGEAGLMSVKDKELLMDMKALWEVLAGSMADSARIELDLREGEYYNNLGQVLKLDTFLRAEALRLKAGESVLVRGCGGWGGSRLVRLFDGSGNVVHESGAGAKVDLAVAPTDSVLKICGLTDGTLEAWRVSASVLGDLAKFAGDWRPQAGSATDGGGAGTPCMYNPALDLRKPALRVLDIGNSYTGDATHYIKEIMAGCGVTPPDRWSMPEDMALVCAIRSGGSWKNWFDILHDADTNGYDIYKSFGGLSVSIKGSENGSSAAYGAGDGSGFRHLLENNVFDLIIIHPVSQAAPYFDRWETDTNNGYLPELIRALRMYQPQASIGAYLVHSYAGCHVGNAEGSSLARWEKIADSVKRLRENYGIDFVIPYGTAIQNLRASSLNNAPYDLTEDGLHSASGISDYTAACCYYQALIAPRYGRSVLGCTARIDQATLNAENESRNIAAEYRGSAKAVTDATARVCQMAAFLACQDWYTVRNPEEYLGEIV